MFYKRLIPPWPADSTLLPYIGEVIFSLFSDPEVEIFVFYTFFFGLVNGFLELFGSGIKI
jgi:hypothetical protein